MTCLGYVLASDRVLIVACQIASCELTRLISALQKVRFLAKAAGFTLIDRAEIFWRLSHLIVRRDRSQPPRESGFSLQRLTGEPSLSTPFDVSAPVRLPGSAERHNALAVEARSVR
jgi:hypothetical protein